MQQGNTHSRGLNLCGSSIDARLEEPVPLRIRTSHEREDADIVTGPDSRHTSSGSVAQLLAGAGPLTIMKRRGRQNRPSLGMYMDASQRSEGTVRESSSSTQVGNGLDGSGWLHRDTRDQPTAKTQSLIIRKIRQRQSSLAGVLKDTFHHECGPSAPLVGRR
jgi:hypothetical protein